MKILLVSFLFAPNNEIGALRPTKICDFLSQRGHIVDVISYGFNGHDNMLVPNNLRSHYFQQTQPFKAPNDGKNASNIKRRDNAFLRFLKEHYRALLSKKTQREFVSFCIKTYKKHLANEKYDALFTSFGPLSSLLAGLKIKKLNPDIKWVCDFRDPVVTEDTPLFFRAHYKRIQKKCCKKADSITTVTTGFLERICPKKYLGKCSVITNGFDERDIISLKPTFKDLSLSLTYAGSLYEGKRKIDPLFRAIKELIKDGTISPERVVFNYAGNDFAFLKSQAYKYDLQDILRNHGRLSRDDCLLLEKSSDILVLSTWNRANETGVFPGKLLEYFMFKKPIIALVDGNVSNSEVFFAIKKSNSGFCYEESKSSEDSKLLKEYLSKQYKRYEAKKPLFFEADLDYLSSYNYRNLILLYEKVFSKN